jgi:hypothetical protein
VSLSLDVVGGPTDRVARFWAATCDQATTFSSIAAVTPGIAFARIDGVTTAHLRGPETSATMLDCPTGAEYFGAELRLGAYLPMFPPARLANLQDAMLPVLSDGRILVDGRGWEMPTPQNLDVFVDRLTRADLLTFEPLAEELCHDEGSTVLAQRTAQSRFRRAVGVSRRTVRVIERARAATRQLRAGASIVDVVVDNGYYDQPHLTRSLKRLIGYTPAELARGGQFLNL